MSTPLAHLGEIRTRGWQILDELMKGKDAAQAIAAEGQWVLDLVTAVKPFSEWWAIKLGTTLSPTTDDEDDFAQDHLNKAAATDKRHCDAIRCHAVRLLRLKELFDEIKFGTVAIPTPAAWKKALAKPLAKNLAAKVPRKAVPPDAIEKWLGGFLVDGKPNVNDTWEAAKKHFNPKVVHRDTLRSLHRTIKAEQTETPPQ